MGLLDGGIASVMGSVFSGIYLPGTLTRVFSTDDGQGGGAQSSTSQPCRIQIDSCTQAQRGEDGFAITDVRILILQSGVAGGTVDTDCQVAPLAGPRAGQSFMIASVTQDPASAYWECRGTPV